MEVILLTLFICVITAVSRVFLKRGMQNSTPLMGMVVSLILGCVILWTVALLTTPLNGHDPKGILYFALIGTVAPPLVRYLTYIGIDRVGASRSDQLRSLTPFFAILFAVVIFGENLNLFMVFAAVLIFSGVVVISQNQMGEKKATDFKKQDLLYPLLAAIVAGVIANMRKLGTGLLAYPVLAAAIAATSAVVVFLVFLIISGKIRELSPKQLLGKHFIFAGLLTSATDVLDLMVLKRGQVSVVVPLLATTPLFVLLLSHIYLRDLEKINRRLVIGAVLIFGGIQVILWNNI